MQMSETKVRSIPIATSRQRDTLVDKGEGDHWKLGQKQFRKKKAKKS